MIGRTHGSEQFLFIVGQGEVTLFLTVHALSGQPAESHDSHVRNLRLRFDESLVDPRFLRAGYRIFLVPAGSKHRIDEPGVETVRSGRNPEPDVRQPLFEGYRMTVMHLAAARTSGYEIIGRLAEKRNPIRFSDRKRIPVVFQQHHRFVRSTLSDLCMPRKIGLQGAGVFPIRGRFLDEAEYPADIPVKNLLIERLVGKRAENFGLMVFVMTVREAAHDDIVARLHLSHPVVAGEPVGHHHSVEAPFVPQHRGQQVAVLGGVHPVKPIIGRHDGPRRSLPDRDLEAAQVNLPKRPLTDHGIDTLAVALLIVRREMLDRSPDALRLNPAHHRGAHFPRQKRIFGIVLEIPSAQRIALNIHRRGQKHVGTVFKRFVTHRVTDRLHQFGIPRSGQRGGCGDRLW